MTTVNSSVRLNFAQSMPRLLDTVRQRLLETAQRKSGAAQSQVGRRPSLR